MESRAGAGSRGPRRAPGDHAREVHDDLGLGPAALAVLGERYLRREERGHPAESTGAMMDRVAAFVAAAEDGYGAGASPRWAERFASTLRRLEFLPNSPTLMNAGTQVGFLSGCVVLPVEDSLRSIFAALGDAAIVHQAGGGTGFSFSRIRPAGDLVASTQGRASGPLSFMELFDAAAGVIHLGGRRRGANMAVLDVGHPDILEFVRAKSRAGVLQHFNLSVGVTDRFMRAVELGGTHRLVNPRNGRTAARLPAAALFREICEAAHAGGDPGLVFLDTMNRANPLPADGRFEATNPCGEVPLLPYESCNLGSINLARLVRKGRVDWDALAGTVEVAVRFLDDVIDVNRYPVPALESSARRTRKIGLGYMGLAEMFASLGIPYDSPQAERLAGRLASYVRSQARRASAALAEERGPFPSFAHSTFSKRGAPPLRNAQLTSVAPTGTISLIAGTTSGIEPMFAVAYFRHILDRQVLELNPLFARRAHEGGFYSDRLAVDIASTGRVRGRAGIPEAVQAAFPTAMEIAPEWHLRVQAAVQRHVDAAVSKTINLPPEATVDDVRAIFLSAWHAKVKGITVYRYGSRAGQVLSLLTGREAAAGAPVRAETSFSGGCAGRLCEF